MNVRFSYVMQRLLVKMIGSVFAASKEPRTPRHPDVVYHVGEVVRSKSRKYRGVIIGWDPRPIVSYLIIKCSLFL